MHVSSFNNVSIGTVGLIYDTSNNVILKQIPQFTGVIKFILSG